jgi:PAS domain-containing protein
MLWVQLCAGAGAISLALLWIIGRISPGERTAPKAPKPEVREAVFLFDGDILFDHDAGAMPPGTSDGMSWAQLRDWLAPRFTALPTSLMDQPHRGPTEIRPCQPDDTGRVTLFRSPYGTRVTLRDPPHLHPAERHELLIDAARMRELAGAFDEAPHPMWKTDTSGNVIWRNAASIAAFDPALCASAERPASGGPQRLPVETEGAARPKWYEVTRVDHAWGALHHATDITKIVTAERMQRDFVQTLTKTFAYLTIGLAVFDRNRKLALFNPALVDLTSLGADFLSGQPQLMAFFDKLRDRRVMPEPRSYASWRSQIDEVIGAAEGGLYQETWSLPNDVTYRVTGRPHPDGAVAFLFEDITAEVMLARRFRSQLDLRQAALDSLPEAVMVVGPNNVLAFCNSAAIDLLGVDPDTSFADMAISDLMRACAQTLPAPDVWREVEGQLKHRQHDTPLRKSAEIAPGLSLSYRVELLPGGARMLILRSFAEKVAKAPACLATG